MSRCPDVCPVVLCQQGLIRSAGAGVGTSNTHMQKWKHHMTTCDLKLSGICCICYFLSKLSNDPRTDPCGTPLNISNQPEKDPFTWTLIFLSDGKSSNHANNFPVIRCSQFHNQFTMWNCVEGLHQGVWSMLQKSPIG